MSIEGVCLTVTRRAASTATFHVGPETARITTLGELSVGQALNLERALRWGDRIGGHWVTGHVEQTGTIKHIKPSGKIFWVTVEVPKKMTRYITSKGSLALDGISLTVVSKRNRLIDLMIIPHTWTHTTLSRKKAGARVNLEADVLAKYALGKIKRLRFN